ncbi:MAG: filamentous hemagglutinin N-terminal domain-containing protein [Elusimicrobiota bacterium]
MIDRFRRILSLTLALSVAMPGSVFANPIGGSVVGGSATIGGAGNTLTVNQLSNNAVINWQSFSIGQGEITRFIQPSAQSAVLNRVTGGNLSAIYGTLSANGRVFLINPNGITVGPTGVINTQSFMASTLDTPNGAFMAGGDLTFSGASLASVVNQGLINALGGDVFLIARSVANTGRIIAADGTAALAAGSEVLLGSKTDGVFVKAGSGGGAVGVDQQGSIDAAKAQLTAAGGNMYAVAINNSGVVRANAVENRGGQVYLTADSGLVQNSGTLSAKNGDKGGLVEVAGGDVALKSGSAIDVSGEYGGGTAYIGGGFHGADASILDSNSTTIEKGATISADALTNGNGGQVAVWSNGNTSFAGAISARGGALGGNGGSAEVSGKNLAFRGPVDLRATGGKDGALLLDPYDIIIDGSLTTGIDNSVVSNPTSNADFSKLNVTDLTNQLALSDVNVQAGGGFGVGAGFGDISVNSAIGWSSAHNLTLTAQNSVNVNAAITNTLGAGGVKLTSAFPAGVILLNADVNTTGGGTQEYNGAVNLMGPVNLTSGGAVTFDQGVAGAQALTINSGAAATNFNGAVAGLASLAVTAGGGINVNGGGVLTAGAQAYHSAVTFAGGPTSFGTSAGNVTFDSTLTGAGTPLGIAAVGDVTLSGAVTAGATTVGGTNVTWNGLMTVGGLGVTAGNAANVNGAVNSTGDVGFLSGAGGTNLHANVATTGAASQAYNGAVNLLQNTTLNSAGTIAFNSTVDGAKTLTTTSAGATTIGGAIGGGTALTALLVNGSSNVGANVTTSGAGAQEYNGAVNLTAASVLTSGGVLKLDSTVNGAKALTTNSVGATTISGAVGGTAALSSLDATAGGGISVNGGAVTTNGLQNYHSAVTLGAADAFTTGGGALTFGAAVTGGANSLTVTAGAGDVAWNAGVSATGITLAGRNLVMNGNLTANGASNVVLEDSLSLNNTAAKTITAAGGHTELYSQAPASDVLGGLVATVLSGSFASHPACVSGICLFYPPASSASPFTTTQKINLQNPAITGLPANSGGSTSGLPSTSARQLPAPVVLQLPTDAASAATPPVVSVSGRSTLAGSVSVSATPSNAHLSGTSAPTGDAAQKAVVHAAQVAAEQATGAKQDAIAVAAEDAGLAKIAAAVAAADPTSKAKADAAAKAAATAAAAQDAANQAAQSAQAAATAAAEAATPAPADRTDEISKITDAEKLVNGFSNTAVGASYTQGLDMSNAGSDAQSQIDAYKKAKAYLASLDPATKAAVDQLQADKDAATKTAAAKTTADDAATTAAAKAQTLATTAAASKKAADQAVADAATPPVTLAKTVAANNAKRRAGTDQLAAEGAQTAAATAAAAAATANQANGSAQSQVAVDQAQVTSLLSDTAKTSADKTATDDSKAAVAAAVGAGLFSIFSTVTQAGAKAASGGEAAASKAAVAAVDQAVTDKQTAATNADNTAKNSASAVTNANQTLANAAAEVAGDQAAPQKAGLIAQIQSLADQAKKMWEELNADDVNGIRTDAMNNLKSWPITEVGNLEQQIEGLGGDTSMDAATLQANLDKVTSLLKQMVANESNHNGSDRINERLTTAKMALDPNRLQVTNDNAVDAFAAKDAQNSQQLAAKYQAAQTAADAATTKAAADLALAQQLEATAKAAKGGQAAAEQAAADAAMLTATTSQAAATKMSAAAAAAQATAKQAAADSAAATQAATTADADSVAAKAEVAKVDKAKAASDEAYRQKTIEAAKAAVAQRAQDAIDTANTAKQAKIDAASAAQDLKDDLKRVLDDPGLIAAAQTTADADKAVAQTAMNAFKTADKAYGKAVDKANAAVEKANEIGKRLSEKKGAQMEARMKEADELKPKDKEEMEFDFGANFVNDLVSGKNVGDSLVDSAGKATGVSTDVQVLKNGGKTDEVKEADESVADLQKEYDEAVKTANEAGDDATTAYNTAKDAATAANTAGNTWAKAQTAANQDVANQTADKENVAIYQGNAASAQTYATETQAAADAAATASAQDKK